MKKLLIILMILTLGTFLACGNDEGDTGVSLEITTEDGVENFGSIAPSDPSYAIPSDVNLWLDSLQVMAYANGKILPRNLLMSTMVSRDALIRDDYLVMDVPSGRDLVFLINALDSKNVIRYSGTVGPVSVRPRSIIPLKVTLSKLIDVTSFVKTDSIPLRLIRSDGSDTFDVQIQNFKLDDGLNSLNVKVNMYTRAVYEDGRWIPTNPDIDTVDFSVAGGYDGNRFWSGGSFFNDMFILITAHVEDNSKGVIFYGTRAYYTLWYPGDVAPAELSIYMQPISRLAVRFNSYPGTDTVRARMVVDGNDIDLFKTGSYVDKDCIISLADPIAVFAAGSGQEWFGGGKTIQERTIKIYKSGVGYPVPELYHTVKMPIGWGLNHIDIP